MGADIAISFPGLGIGEINPSYGFIVFGKDIRWYGVIIACGMLLALLYAMKRSEKFGLKSDTLIDCFLYGVPVGVVFARLYYCVFFRENGVNPYFKDPVSILKIWEGGLAIYGGVIGALLTAFVYTRIKKKKLLPILDLVCLGFMIGQGLGRWGNFFNREAYGAAVSETYFLRMGLTQYGSTVFVHPTFLYESLWNLIGFVALHFISKKRKYDGQILLLYLAWYGLGRCWIEGLRTDSLYLGSTGIRVSQLIAGASFIIAVTVMAYIRFVVKPGPERMLVNSPASEVREDVEDEEDDLSEDEPEAVKELEQAETAEAQSEDTHPEDTQSEESKDK